MHDVPEKYSSMHNVISIMFSMLKFFILKSMCIPFLQANNVWIQVKLDTKEEKYVNGSVGSKKVSQKSNYMANNSNLEEDGEAMLDIDEEC